MVQNFIGLIKWRKRAMLRRIGKFISRISSGASIKKEHVVYGTGLKINGRIYLIQSYGHLKKLGLVIMLI